MVFVPKLQKLCIGSGTPAEKWTWFILATCTPPCSVEVLTVTEHFLTYKDHHLLMHFYCSQLPVCKKNVVSDPAALHKVFQWLNLSPASQMYRCLSKAVLCFQEIDPHGFLMYSIQLPEWVCSKLCNKLLVLRIKGPADEMTATKQNTKHRRYQEAWETYVAAYGLDSREQIRIWFAIRHFNSQQTAAAFGKTH